MKRIEGDREKENNVKSAERRLLFSASVVEEIDR
jgi:hypothetical protein